MKFFGKTEPLNPETEKTPSFLDSHREWRREYDNRSGIKERIKEHADALKTSSLIAAGAVLFAQNPGAKEALVVGAMSAVALGIDKAPWKTV